MRALVLVPVCAALLASTNALAASHAYAVVVGVNTSNDKGVAALKFADDDAAKYTRLLDRLADDVTLLTVFDTESRAAYDDLARRAKVPERRELEKVLNEIGRKVQLDHQRGDTSTVYFVYTGHGAREKNGEGYVNLVDEKLTRTELHRLLLARSNSESWERPDTLHVIVDACSAYFLVHDRGSDLTPSDKDYSANAGELFGAGTTPEKYPHVGYILATTGDVKVHEWSAYRGGVFSHLVRSALSGAADVDLDGRVTYAELGAFIAAASGTIKDPRARIDVTVTPPPANAEAAVSERSRFTPRQLVLLDASMAGHFEVESEDGERLLDLNKPRGMPSVFAVWGAGKYYLASNDGESVLDFSHKTVIASASMAFGEKRRAERGAIDEEYRRALFSRPFDNSFLEAYCSLMHLPPPTAQSVVVPQTEKDLLDAMGPQPLSVGAGAMTSSSQRSTVRPGTWAALGGGVLFGASSALLFTLSSSARDEAQSALDRGTTNLDAESRRATLSAAGAGAAVAAGAALIVGGSLLSLDLLHGDSGHVALAPGGRGLSLAGSF